MEIQNGTLSPKLRELGFELIEDNHIVELKNNGVSIALFSATGATAEEIHKEAEKWLQEEQRKIQSC